MLVRDANVGQSMCGDDSHLYWIDSRATRLMKASQQGGEVMQLATIEYGGIVELECDGVFVYWSVFDSGTVSKVAVDGGPVSVIASNQTDVWKLAQDETNVYWVAGPGTESRNVMKAAKSGAAPSVVASDIRPGDIVSDGGYLYFGTGGAFEVVRVPRDGGAVARFPANGYTTPIGVSAGQLYFVEFSIGLSRMSLSGGAVTNLFKTDALWLKLDYPYAYWKVDGGVQRRSLTSNTEESFLRFNGASGEPGAFVVGKERVFVGWGANLYVVPK